MPSVGTVERQRGRDIGNSELSTFCSRIQVNSDIGHINVSQKRKIHRQ
jgi:hypothetical protein